MMLLEVQKEELSKELSEKDQIIDAQQRDHWCPAKRSLMPGKEIIDAQQREPSQKQKVINRLEKIATNFRVQQQEVKEMKKLTQ